MEREREREREEKENDLLSARMDVLVVYWYTIMLKLCISTFSFAVHACEIIHASMYRYGCGLLAK